MATSAVAPPGPGPEFRAGPIARFAAVVVAIAGAVFGIWVVLVQVVQIHGDGQWPSAIALSAAFVSGGLLIAWMVHRVRPSHTTRPQGERRSPLLCRPVDQHRRIPPAAIAPVRRRVRRAERRTCRRPSARPRSIARSSEPPRSRCDGRGPRGLPVLHGVPAVGRRPRPDRRQSGPLSQAADSSVTGADRSPRLAAHGPSGLQFRPHRGGIRDHFGGGRDVSGVRGGA